MNPLVYFKRPGVGCNSLIANVLLLNPETLYRDKLDETVRDGVAQQNTAGQVGCRVSPARTKRCIPTTECLILS